MTNRYTARDLLERIHGFLDTTIPREDFVNGELQEIATKLGREIDFSYRARCERQLPIFGNLTRPEVEDKYLAALDFYNVA